MLKSPKTLYRFLLFVFIVGSLTSCDMFAYSFHNKTEKSFARPDVFFMDAIVAYRNEYHFWPSSMEQFAGSSAKNKKLADDFKYHYTDFKVSDSNRLKIIFTDIKHDDDYQYLKGKIDLNTLNGEIRFFKANDRFTYKVKMR